MHLNARGRRLPRQDRAARGYLPPKMCASWSSSSRRRRIEGEIQQLGGAGQVTELGGHITGATAGSSSDREVTIFDSVGFALNDFSALRYLHRLNAEQPDGGQRIDLIPEPDDPKDLFAGLAQRSRARAAPEFA